MSDDGPAGVPALPGEKATWPATVRDLLRYVRAESPAPEELRTWWLETVEEAETRDDPEPAASPGAPGAADRRLAFLESAGLVDLSSAPATPGRYGREYLDSHDETVLYEGLASALEGLETVLEALAISPLTDVEVADLLAAERREQSVDRETARGHRRWLGALGLLDHDDGVNELTRRGRRVVDADGGLELSGCRVPAGESPPDASEAAASDASGDATHDGESGATDGGAGAGGGDSGALDDEDGTETGGGDGSAEREPAASRVTDRRIDRPYVRELKALYDDACAICGDRRRRAGGSGISRVHHLMPPGDDHGGPATPENAVVVCPNHCADLEHGTVTVDPRSLRIEHAYEPEVTGRTLTTAGDHEPAPQYLAYHDAVVADRPE